MNFKLDRMRSLVCTVSTPGLDKQKDEDMVRKEKGASQEPKPKTWEDVVWKIGTVRTYDSGQKASKIPLAQFEEWLSMTPDIAPRTKIIQTPDGSLILDHKYAGKVYLQNLLLPNASSSGMEYMFGTPSKMGRPIETGVHCQTHKKRQRLLLKSGLPPCLRPTTRAQKAK